MPPDDSTPPALPVSSPLIERALELAAQWHDGTYRKGGWRDPAFDVPEGERVRVPVMAHLTAVAMTVQRPGCPPPVVAAAFLHDTLEDQNRYEHHLRHDQLVGAVGAAVTEMVEGVTEQKYDAEGAPRGWRERKEGYVQQLRRGPVEVVALSLADKLHNLWTMNQSLSEDIDVFSAGERHVGLNAGPAQQQWFHRAVLEAAHSYDDPRLVPLLRRVEEELERFEARCGLDAPAAAPFERGDGSASEEVAAGEATVLVVTGVSGAGKTTVGRKLAEALGWPFYEGDAFHPAENVEQMTDGDPLTDADRAPWLRALRDLIEDCLQKGESAVLACSALRKVYRDQLKQGDPHVRFIYLKGSRALLRERIGGRRGHFMPPGLLESQLAALEEPEEDALIVNIAPPPDEIVARICEKLEIAA